MIVLIGVLFDFDMDQNKNIDNNHFYLFFKDIHLFIFIGFGMLYSALRDHQWSSIFLVLFLGIVAIEFSFFSYYLWANTFSEKFSKININFNVLICIEYCAASAIVSLGGLMGKLSLIQYFVVVIFETFMSCFNFFLCYDKLDLFDNGGSITIHLFGAIFGLGVSIVLFCNDTDFMKIDNNPHITSNYRSNMFAFIGSIFLWLFFPSFNVAIVKIKQYENYYVSPELGFITENLRYRGIINTYLSMMGSVFTSFIISPLFYRGKMKIEHILHASYVGGIVIGGCCTICSNAWASIVIGIIGSTISILFLWRIKKLLHSIRFEDTIGVLQIFAIPGLLGGIITAIYLRNFTSNTAWNDGGMAAIFGSGNAKPEARAGTEITCIFVSLGIAAFSGVITGFLAKSLMCIDVENYFVDSEIFMEEEGVVFPEFEFQDERVNTLNSSGNKLDYEGKEININNNQNFEDNNINNKENNNVNNFNNIDNVDNIDV
jgi:ammonium transporter Rh